MSLSWCRAQSVLRSSSVATRFRLCFAPAASVVLACRPPGSCDACLAGVCGAPAPETASSPPATRAQEGCRDSKSGASPPPPRPLLLGVFLLCLPELRLERIHVEVEHLAGVLVLVGRPADPH